MPDDRPSKKNPTDKTLLERISKDFVNLLAAILRMAQIHDPSNASVITAIQKFITVVNGYTKTGDDLMFEVVGEYVYVNEARVKLPLEFMMNFDFLAKEFKKIKLGSITFSGNVTNEDVNTFLKSFLTAAFSSEPYTDLADGIATIKSIAIGPERKVKEDNVEVDARKTVKNTYFNAVSFTKGVMNKVKSGEKINAKKAKRVVQSMVDLLLKEEELMVGMTAIKDYDDYTYHHCVNVSVVSIALGQKLGFSKQALLELGLVALFHDIGKMEIPPEVLNKPSSFTEEEWKLVRRHPIWGVRAILKMKGFDLISIRAAIAAFEHHQKLDNTGYPARKFPTELDLYSRIVSLADQYDGMTSARVYSRTPMSPEKALSLMMERSGTQLDPLLFKFFVNMVGVFPVGTAVMLNTKEIALVLGPNMSFPNRPHVLIITDSQGHKIDSIKVDLSEKGDGGQFKRSIVKTMDPHKYKINLAEYLL